MQRTPRWLRVVVAGVAGTLVFVALSPVGLAPRSGPSVARASTLAELSASFQDLAARVGPSVVQIFTTGYGPGQAGASLIEKQRATGSGVILDADGYVVTNAHVVAGARRVQVMIPLSPEERGRQGSILKPPGTLVGGQVIGIDRETDLAVVKVAARQLTPLELGDSDALAAGQIVLAFGSPLGLSNSVTLGVVSSVARQLAPEHPVVYIQTDAPINPGNSGGPLVDATGRVIGINTMILSQSGGSEGIGFAVPSNIVRNVYQQIRSTGRVHRGHIGVHAQTLDPVLARALGLSREAGVILGDVYPGSPADKAGLHAGDIVLALDGKPMENGRQFDVNLYRRAAGTEVTISYLRDGRERDARVAVAERPDDPERFADMVTPEQNLVPRLGILGIDLTQNIAALLPGLRVREGVVVAAQSSQGPAWRDSFQPGDVIVAFNGARVGDLDALRAAVAAARAGDAVAVRIQRGPRMQYLWFEME